MTSLNNCNSDNISKLTSISPVDGRYYSQVNGLRLLLSEYGLIKHRVEVEIKWLIFLAKQSTITEIDSFSGTQLQDLASIYQNFTLEDAEKVKSIENITNHDVKAVEYFIKDRLSNNPAYNKYLSFIHFACTSEDINNISYSLLLAKTREQIITPSLNEVHQKLIELADLYKTQTMLSRTHGQAASPTTMGKELVNFAARLNHNIKQLDNTAITAKMNGAVGNYNAHHVTYPNINWPELAQVFIESLGLEFNKYTTQINPHDDIAELCHCLIRVNNIILDLVRDIWTYISMGYFTQKIKANEVGSSTMPHKVNPIDFENAEGNLGLANSMLEFFSNKLPISRLQRDLSDSTVLRNMGCALSYCQIAYKSLLKGLNKLNINSTIILRDLNNNWEILAEPIQTIMRRYGIDNAYEQLKELTRGNKLDQTLLHEFINNLPSDRLDKKTKDRLKQLTPQEYIGYADKLVDLYLQNT